MKATKSVRRNGKPAYENRYTIRLTENQVTRLGQLGRLEKRKIAGYMREALDTAMGRLPSVRNGK